MVLISPHSHPIAQLEIEMSKHLTEMTAEELQKQKAAWYREAHESGKIDAICMVGRELGESLSCRYGPKYSYKNGDIEIYIDDYGHYSTVTYKGKQVVSTHPCSGLYVPGDWEEEVLRYADAALAKQNEERLAREERERQKLLSELRA